MFKCFKNLACDKNISLSVKQKTLIRLSLGRGFEGNFNGFFSQLLKCLNGGSCSIIQRKFDSPKVLGLVLCYTLLQTITQSPHFLLTKNKVRVKVKVRVRVSESSCCCSIHFWSIKPSDYRHTIMGGARRGGRQPPPCTLAFALQQKF